MSVYSSVSNVALTMSSVRTPVYPRNEEELDPVTLHNQALVGMETDPTSGFRKLNFLVANPPFPPETFGGWLPTPLRRRAGMSCTKRSLLYFL